MSFEYKMPESEDEVFEQGLEKINHELLRELEELYPEAEYQYHNCPHSRGVGDKAVQFLEALPEYKNNRRALALARTVGYAHDRDQEHIWVDAENGLWRKRVRNGELEGGAIKRIPGKIEEASLKILIAKEEQAGLTLTEGEKEVQREALMVTVPGFEEVRDPESGESFFTVTQPNLTPNSQPETFAIAAADIAGPGYNPEHFLKDGDNVFNEGNEFPLPEILSDTDAEIILAESLKWSKSQISFVQGQKVLWNRDFIPEFIKSQLTEFDTSIRLAQERYEARVALIATGATPQEKLRLLLDDMNFTRYKK